MEQRLSDLETKITSIDTKLTQVVDAILGNPLTKNGGFVDEINELTEKVERLQAQNAKHEEFRKKILWTVSIIVAIGAVVSFAIDLYFTLAKK